MTGLQSYVLSKKFTKDTVIGLGAIKGAPCTVKKTEHKDGCTYVTLQWTANDGVTTQETVLTILDGTPIYDYTPGNEYHYGDLVIYAAQFYRCVADCIAGTVLDDRYFSEIGSADGNYDIVQDVSQLPARFTPADRKMYYSIEDGFFYLWDGEKWAPQEPATISDEDLDELFI